MASFSVTVLAPNFVRSKQQLAKRAVDWDFADKAAKDAGINVDSTTLADVDASATKAQVDFVGHTVHPITNGEREAFNIRDQQLKSIVMATAGKKPNDAFVGHHKNWNNLYKTYGWKIVTSKTKIIGVQAEEIKFEDVTLHKQNFTNTSEVEANFNVAHTQSVTTSVEHSWSHDHTINVSQSINYSIGLIGGETGFSYSYNWGKSQTRSKTVSAGVEHGVAIALKPNTSADVRMMIRRGTQVVRVTYETTLDGQVATNYNPKYKIPGKKEPHHFYAFKINKLLDNAKKPKSIISTETITYAFYSEASLIVKRGTINGRAKGSKGDYKGDTPSNKDVHFLPIVAMDDRLEFIVDGDSEAEDETPSDEEGRD